jgi:pilus assembly protein Flp/PilA
MNVFQFAWIRASTWLAERVSKDERGATAVEYGIMVALIAAVIVVTVGLLGKEIKAAFCDVLVELGGTCPA